MQHYIVVNTSDSDWTTSARTTDTVNSSDDDGTTTVIVIHDDAARNEPSLEEIEAIVKAYGKLPEDISFQRESWCIQIIFHLIQHLERIRTYAHRHRRITSRCRGPPDY